MLVLGMDGRTLFTVASRLFLRRVRWVRLPDFWARPLSLWFVFFFGCFMLASLWLLSGFRDFVFCCAKVIVFDFWLCGCCVICFCVVGWVLVCRVFGVFLGV